MFLNAFLITLVNALIKGYQYDVDDDKPNWPTWAVVWAPSSGVRVVFKSNAYGFTYGFKRSCYAL
jgi:hypothetical protein